MCIARRGSYHSVHQRYSVLSEGDTLPLLRGEVVFDALTPAFAGATLFVTLRDTTELDIPSAVVASEIVRDVSYDPAAGHGLDFTLRGSIPDDKAVYTLEVLVDLDGDGRIGRGDYINKESYPVLTHGRLHEVCVRVARVS